MNATLPDIFEYTNYRQYLEDYRNAKRKVDSKFTHAYICEQLGHPNTRSFLSDIITGRKMLSSTFIDMMAELLKLDKKETHYFRALVYYNQAVLPKDKDFYFEQVIRFKKIPLKVLDKKARKYYQNWYNIALIALLDMYDIKNDFSELTTKLRPEITKEQVEESIILLSDLGLVAYNDQGFLKPTNNVISAGEDVIQAQIHRQLQIQCLELGRQAFLTKDNITNKALTMTIALSSDELERIVASLRRCKSEIASIVGNSSKVKPDKVYQLNIHLFSLDK